MGELSKKEKEVLNFLLEYIDFQIFCIEQQERDLGRLDYSLCSDDNEKQTVTTKKVQKFKKKISKCNPIIAGYLNALTTPDTLNTGFEELRQIISKNFILTEYYELFEELTNSDLKDLQRYKFESVIESLGYDNKPLNDFIQGVCDVNSFFTYKSFLDIPNDTDLTYDKVVKKLNDAFFKLEAFMNGTINRYKYFDFNTAFTELFYFTRKTENYTYENCKLIGEYWQLAEQIRRDYDQSDFKNLKANQNKDFCKNCDVITSIAWDRVEEFTSFATSDEINFETRKKSISDIINNKQGVITINKFIDTNEDIDIKNIDNHQKSKAINLFTEKLCDVSILDETPFSELYPWYFIEFTTNLKDEIINNLTFLTDVKFDLYLNWLKDKIENSYVYDPEACIIDRWIKEFNLIEAEFPFDFNQDVSKLISSFDDTTLKPDEARKVRMIQLEFHWYAVYLEYKKIMAFISELKTNKTSVIIIPDDTKPTNPYPRIFTSDKAFDKFENLLDEFGNSNQDLANYSFVFHRMKKDSLIFKDLKQLEFIDFLSSFEIHLDRLKPESQLGNNDLREGIYNRI
jgi:hypothetical protein